MHTMVDSVESAVQGERDVYLMGDSEKETVVKLLEIPLLKT